MSPRCHRIGTGPTHSPCKYLGFIFFTTFIMTDNSSTFIMTPLIPMMITLTTVAYITFCRVRKEDRGRFLCVGKNKVGNATAPALLKVKCEWKKIRWKMKRWEINEFSVKPEIRKFPRYSKFAVNQMHQVRVIMSPVIIVMIFMFDTVLVIVMSSPSSNMWKQRDKNDWKGWRRPKGFLDRDWSQSKIQSDLRSGFL